MIVTYKLKLAKTETNKTAGRNKYLKRNEEQRQEYNEKITLETTDLKEAMKHAAVGEIPTNETSMKKKIYQ